VLSLGAPVATCTKLGSCTYAPAKDVLSTLGGKKPHGTVYLETAAGAPIAGAQVKIIDGKRTSMVTTGPNGASPFTLAVGASRRVEVSYAGSSSHSSASLTISVEDRAYATIRLVRAAAGRATFVGKVIGANGKPAKLPVKLQYMAAGGQWRTIITVHSSAAGRWQARVNWPLTAHASRGRTVNYRAVAAGNPSAQLSARMK
jgi:D-serine deaminase-like pyridoxal phosphate-dependent protein